MENLIFPAVFLPTFILRLKPCLQVIFFGGNQNENKADIHTLHYVGRHVAGLLYGPLTSVLISVIVSFIEMITISATGPYGFLMNVVSTCAFAVPAAWFYQKHRTQKGAVIGLTLGVITMVVAMLLWNYIITPFYMGVAREVVAGMLMTVFLPFNLVKGGINAGLTLLLYKPIVNALRKAHLAEPSKSGSQKGSFSLGFTLFAVAVLVSFLLWLLVLIGVL